MDRHALTVIFKILLFLAVHKLSEEGSTTSGKRFLVQVPTLRFESHDTYIPRVTFHMATLHAQCQVKRFVHSFGNYVPIMYYNFGRREMNVTEVLDNSLLPKEQTGGQWSLEFLSTTDFILEVHINILSSAHVSWPVLPVAGWGKNYFVVTFHFAPSMTVLTVMDCDVTFQLRFNNPTTTRLPYDNIVYRAGNKLSVKLRQFEAFSIGLCNNTKDPTGSMTGTYITSTSIIGVIAGSCYQHTYENEDCRKALNSQMAMGRQDIVAEMPLPAETYGKEFVTFEGDLNTHGKYCAVALDHLQTLVYVVGSPRDAELSLERLGDSKLLEIGKNACVIKSTKPILLMYMSARNCPVDRSALVAPDLTQIVPFNMYYSEYYWCTPPLHVINNIYIIASKNGMDSIMLDGTHLSGFNWNAVESKAGWFAGQGNLVQGCHHTFTHTKRVERYACYLFGRRYLRPAGYISSPVNEMGSVHCSKTDPVINDLEDNDCDDLVDEEIKDEEDNDGDLMRDEDLSATHGNWSEWTEWECSTNCSDTNSYRRRYCNNPAPGIGGRNCSGINMDRMHQKCHFNFSCPGLCPDFSWNLHCTNSCINCVEACDKFSGTCEACNAGYKNPTNSCSTHCQKHEYGINCSGSCLEKCGVDCLESIEEDVTDFAPFLIILALLPLLSYFIFRRKHSEIVVHGEGEGDVISADSDGSVDSTYAPSSSIS